MDNIEKIIKNKILAILPKYIDNTGNCSIIITHTDKIIVNKTINTVLKILARYLLVDIDASKRYCRETIGISNCVPIIFNDDNIFIPIKVRKPISRNDGALGYFNVNHIDKIKKREQEVFISLVGSTSIKCMQSYKTIINHLNHGKIIKKLYKERNKDLEMLEFYKEYEKPATKKDILILRNEILDIKSRLKQSN